MAEQGKRKNRLNTGVLWIQSHRFFKGIEGLRLATDPPRTAPWLLRI